MFYPGDIVALKEPDIGEEEAVIFVCYTKLYDDEFDCVLIERQVKVEHILVVHAAPLFILSRP